MKIQKTLDLGNKLNELEMKFMKLVSEKIMTGEKFAPDDCLELGLEFAKNLTKEELDNYFATNMVIIISDRIKESVLNTFNSSGNETVN